MSDRFVTGKLYQFLLNNAIELMILQVFFKLTLHINNACYFEKKWQSLALLRNNLIVKIDIKSKNVAKFLATGIT
ncbi:hypothetical protein QUB60_10845 [Microcoleus sp. A2-C5]|uniref:hypothetical protein n=1 Tax=Microcoleus sp. A2-C2 TaxID=2818530 RepID=UPI002FD01DC7